MAIICFTGHILVRYVFQICGFVIVVVSMYFIYVFPFDIEKKRERKGLWSWEVWEEG